jgi:Family of unknown function (DUF5996)
MSLPSLHAWQPTANSLHKAAQLVGLVGMLARPHEPLYLEVGMKPVPQGVSSGVLPNGGAITLNYTQGTLEVDTGDGVTSIPIQGVPQAHLFNQVFSLLEETTLAPAFEGVQGELVYERVAAAFARRGLYGELSAEAYYDHEPLMIDAQVAAEYALVQDAVFTGIARFRARLTGLMTPAVIYGEHFDLSMMWFRDNALDDYQAHLNFGFAPFSAGLERPYLYAYAYPYPAEFTPPALPQGAHWHSEGWRGVVLPYDVIAQQENAVTYVEAQCMAIFAALRPLLG